MNICTFSWPDVYKSPCHVVPGKGSSKPEALLENLFMFAKQVKFVRFQKYLGHLLFNNAESKGED